MNNPRRIVMPLKTIESLNIWRLSLESFRLMRCQRNKQEKHFVNYRKIWKSENKQKNKNKTKQQKLKIKQFLNINLTIHWLMLFIFRQILRFWSNEQTKNYFSW